MLVFSDAVKMWAFQVGMDEYIARLEFEGSIDLSVGKTQEPNLPLPVENLGSDRAVLTTGSAPNAELPAELKVELKKINKHLRQMINLKKQANMMAGGFYSCIICICLFYLLSIRH